MVKFGLKNLWNSSCSCVNELLLECLSVIIFKILTLYSRGIMPGRHESGMPIDADLLEGHVGVYSGEPRDSLGRLVVSRIGIAIFPAQNLEIVAAELGFMGYIPNSRLGRSVVSGEGSKTDVSYGELHRHDDVSVIVHRTPVGSGLANFYWPTDPDTSYLDHESESLELSAVDVRLNQDTIIVFPANTWHEFGTDAGVTRNSQFRHYYPVSPE